MFMPLFMKWKEQNCVIFIAAKDSSRSYKIDNFPSISFYCMSWIKIQFYKWLTLQEEKHISIA